MTFRILDASYLLDWAMWESKLAEFPQGQRDIHFEPAYVAAYAAEIGAKALCATYDGGRGIYPFVLKEGPPKEVACAYGYGGQLIEGSVTVWDDFDKWCTKNGVQREFYRTHPFVHETVIPSEKRIVYMDLSLKPEAELRKGHKSSLATARRSNVTIEPCDELELFRDMYLTTMGRLEASEYWMFSNKLLPALKTAYPAGFQFLLAKVDGKPEAGCILLGAHQTCYYHYAGSYGRHRNIGVGQAIVVEAARWAKARGYTRLHLGGGTTADPKDPLFVFKSGFSKRRAWIYKYEREFKV